MSESAPITLTTKFDYNELFPKRKKTQFLILVFKRKGLEIMPIRIPHIHGVPWFTGIYVLVKQYN